MCTFTAEIKPPERFILYSSLRLHWEKLLCGTNTLLCCLPIPVFSGTKNNCCKNISMQMLWCFVNAFN